MSVWGDRGFRGICRGIGSELFRLRLSVTKLGEFIAERHHCCGEFRSINDFILRNWGACVDTIFWARVQDGRIRWQYVVYRMSCRWGWLPIKERLDVTKFTGDDVSVPMTMMRRSADDHGKRVCRWYRGGVWKLLIGLWKSFNLSRGIAELIPYLFKSFCIRIPCNLEFEFWSCLVIALWAGYKYGP
jgi:hypothetical protein